MSTTTTAALTPEELAAKLDALDDETICFDGPATYALIRDAAHVIRAQKLHTDRVDAKLVEQRAEIERLTAAEADRDALLSALGFKGGPLGDDMRRKVILDDAAALRPAMVKARRRADEAEAGAMLADGFVSERGGLLLRIWEMRAGERRKRREAEARATTAEAALAAMNPADPDWREVAMINGRALGERNAAWDRLNEELAAVTAERDRVREALTGSKNCMELVLRHTDHGGIIHAMNEGVGLIDAALQPQETADVR